MEEEINKINREDRIGTIIFLILFLLLGTIWCLRFTHSPSTYSTITATSTLIERLDLRMSDRPSPFPDRDCYLHRFNVIFIATLRQGHMSMQPLYLPDEATSSIKKAYNVGYYAYICNDDATLTLPTPDGNSFDYNKALSK